MRKYRVAIIGMDHIHASQLYTQMNSFVKEKVEWVGYADTIECSEELRAYRYKLNFFADGIKRLKYYDDYKNLLNDNIDIAVICTDIASHGKICEETLSRGIHTIVEKPMATTIEDGLRMYNASKKYKDAKLVINWPVAWFPAFNKAKELADSGIVGDILRFQYRTPSTRGPYTLNENSSEDLSKLWWYNHDRGGGSISDYAGYGFALSTWFMDKDKVLSVSGVKKSFFLDFCDVEDFSSFMIEYENGVSYIEGSWSTMSNGEIPTGPIIYGTNGVIVADRYSKEVKVYTDFKPYVKTPEPNFVYETEEPFDNVSLNLFNHLESGTPLHELLTVDFNIKAMAVMDAGIRSCESKKSEKIDFGGIIL